jgi:hypothetical protein
MLQNFFTRFLLAYINGPQLTRVEMGTSPLNLGLMACHPVDSHFLPVTLQTFSANVHGQFARETMLSVGIILPARSVKTPL